MLTENTYKEFGAFLNLCTLCNGLPFTFNKETRKMVVIPSYGRRFLYLAMVFWLLIRGVYTSSLVALSWFGKRSSSTTDTVMELCYASSFLVAFILNLGYYVKKHSLANLVNHLFKFDGKSVMSLAVLKKGLEKEPVRNRGNDGVTAFIKFLRMSPVTTAFSFGGFLYAIRRKKDMYLCYPLGENHSNPALLSLYFILESYTLLWMWCMTFFLWFVVLIYGNISNFWLEQISAEKNVVTDSSTRFVVTTYRAIHILTTEFNNTFQHIYWPAFMQHVVLMQTVSIYTCVKSHDTVHISILLSYIFCIVLCTIYQSVTLKLAGRTGALSAKFRERSCWMPRRVIRSFPVLGVSVSICHVMDRQTVVMFMSLVINVVVNFLVST